MAEEVEMLGMVDMRVMVDPGNTPIHGIGNDGSGNRNDDDGYNTPYGGNGGRGGDAVGGRGGNGDDGADKTIISINKGY